MKRISIVLVAATCFAVPACSSDSTPTGDDTGSGSDTPPKDEWDQILDARVYDYNAALRIAALRLTGDLPTMDEINHDREAPRTTRRRRPRTRR